MTVQRKRVYDIDKMQETLPLRLNAFDLLYDDGDDLTPPAVQRAAQSARTLIRKGTGLAVAPALISGDRRELEQFFETQLGAGLEGIVAKRLDSASEAGKRNFNWIKFKRAYHGELKDTLDLTIVGYFQAGALSGRRSESAPCWGGLRQEKRPLPHDRQGRERLERGGLDRAPETAREAPGQVASGEGGQPAGASILGRADAGRRSLRGRR